MKSKCALTEILAIAIILSMWSLSHGQDKTANQIDREQSILFDGVITQVFGKNIGPGIETPIQTRAILYISLTIWNAWSNYHPTAVDIFGRSRFKRPRSEHTARNKNTAILFALYRLCEFPNAILTDSDQTSAMRAIIRSQGLDPDNRNFNTSSAIGIGNRVGLDTARLAASDGWNEDGSLTAIAPPYRLPFMDHTGYRPKNSPWESEFPLKWQPGIESQGDGFFYRHEFVTPQAGSAIFFTMTPKEVSKRRVASPYGNIDARSGQEMKEDIEKLRSLARKVLKTSAELTETKRLLAEFFDNKLSSFRSPATPSGVGSIADALRFSILPNTFDWSYDDDIVFGLASALASFDAIALAWKEKRRIDGVRPTGQTMAMLFGKRRFRAWGGPGRRAIKITAAEWQPYLRTMPHSEFPSASACLCASVVEHALVVSRGRDNLPFSFTIPEGTSSIHPGKVPDRSVTITIRSLSEWSRLCGESRLWAGVHFEPAISAGRSLCAGVGKKAHRVVQTMLQGKVNENWLMWRPQGTDQFWKS